jgi:hypothetical protein
MPTSGPSADFRFVLTPIANNESAGRKTEKFRDRALRLPDQFSGPEFGKKAKRRFERAVVVGCDSRQPGDGSP